MDHLIDDEELPRHERELTLSTGSILGIFLVLALLCGAFFGFGYNMGRKSAPTPLNLSEINTDPSLPGVSNAAKPAAGSPLDDSATTATVAPVTKPVRKPTPSQPAPDSPDTADALPVAKPTPVKTPTPVPTAAPIVRQPAPISPSALSPSATPASGGGSFMVQVAAVSHQEDADLLIGALRARGYAVSARTTSGDSFIHVQVGPFHDKQAADAMRQRLLTDGYNAIVKQ